MSINRPPSPHGYTAHNATLPGKAKPFGFVLLAACLLILLAAGCGVQDPIEGVSFLSNSIRIAGINGQEGAPLEQQTVSGDVTVFVEGGWIGSVSFYLDREVGAQEANHFDDAAPFEFVIDTTTLVDGPHYLAVEASHSNSRASKALVEVVEFQVDNSAGTEEPPADGEEPPADGEDPPASGNTAPVVSAGEAGTTQLGTAFQLNGSVRDDGLPAGALSVRWSKTSGPGSVQFTDPTKAATLVQFSEAGTYRLTLAANDGELSSSDTVQVVVEPAPEPDTGSDMGTVYWSHDFENGKIDPFKEWHSGDYESKVVSGRTHSGNYAARGTIWAPASDGQNSGIRFAVPFLEDGSKLPRDAYYSGWFYIPQTFKGSTILFQYKQHNPNENKSNVTYTISARDRKDSNRVHLVTTSHVGTDGVHKGQNAPRTIASASIDVPIGQWFQLECHYVWSETDGAWTCWQDGTRLWHFDGIQTDYGYGAPDNGVNKHRQWIIGNYSRDIDPSPLDIFIDDVVISSGRASN